MARIREPAVAGIFYPAERDALSGELAHYLAAAAADDSAPPKAIIAPHAGYIYSGPIAASAYARISPLRGTVTRVVVLGPSHRIAFHGIATTSADYFRTPLGDIPIDRSALEQIGHFAHVREIDAAHAQEHSIEVQLPFLQAVLGDFSLVPLVVGDLRVDETADVIEMLWGGPETLVVASSDLSHYHDYRTAQQMDRATSRAIEEKRVDEIEYENACGRNPVAGLLEVARRHGYSVTTIDLRNSGDTAGSRDRVVGYGAYLLH